MESIQMNITTGLTDQQRKARRARRAHERKIRQIKATAMLLAIMAIGIIFGVKAFIADNTEWVVNSIESVCVEENDTLWGICSDSCPDSWDIRDYIDYVVEFNGMESVELYVGDYIEVPTLIQVVK